VAWYQLRRGDHGGALLSLKNAKSADALYVRGLAGLRGGYLESARVDLEKAVQLEPSRDEPKQALGVVLLESGDADKARATFAELPKDPLAQIGEAVAWAELGKPKEAESRLGRLLGEKGAVGDAAATDLAAIRRTAGNGDAALKVIPDRPLTPVGWLVKALLLAEHKQPKPAVQALKAATEDAPTYIDAWLQLARTFESQNDTGNAKAAAARALELQPTLVEAMAIRARAFGKEGDTAKQAAELARIRELGEKASTAAAPSKHTVAVVAFDNNTGDKALDWMRNGVAEALISDLSHLGSLTIIERTQVQKAFQEQKLQELGFTDAKDASKVGKLLGADALLVGAISKSGDQIRLDGRVLEIGTSKILKTGSATGGLNQIFEVERKLAIDLVAEYAAITSREKVDFFNAKTPSLQSLETQGRLRMLSSQGKAKEAKEAYERLLREDPKAAEKFKDLQKQWENVASTVAIMPLKNVAERPEDQWLGVGIAEALTTDLKKVGLFLVERAQVEKVMQERQLTEIFSEQKAIEVGKLAGASILFVGSYQVQGSYLRIDGRLVDVTTAQILQSYTVEGKKDELFDAENRLVKQVAEALKVEPSKIEKEQLAKGKPSLDDFKRYIQASSKLVVKEAANTEITVKSLAVGELKDAKGAVDKAAGDALKRALEKNGSAPVRVAASQNPKDANADALVLGTITRLPDKLRVDLRAVHAASGEVVASSTATGASVDELATEDQAATSLLTRLGLKRAEGSGNGPGGKTPVYKKWYLWTIVGLVVAGGAVAGGILGTQYSQTIPRSDATITAK
jgi:TolB-like protein/Tfp pilus assembly protein PilF